MYTLYVNKSSFQEFFSLNYSFVIKKCDQIFKKPAEQKEYYACISFISAVISDINAAKDNNLPPIWNFLQNLPKYGIYKSKEFEDIIFFFNVMAVYYDVSIDDMTLVRTKQIQEEKALYYASRLKGLLSTNKKTIQVWKMIENKQDKKMVETILTTLFEFDPKYAEMMRCYKLKYFYDTFDLLKNKKIM